MPEPKHVRRERSHVEFPAATWTSFDRYARYGAIARAVRANLGPGVHDVLDVGDASGYLHAFDRDLRPVSIDRHVIGEPLADARRIEADGARLPIRDRAVTAVVSSDALEHVPPGDRGAFVAELTRVTRGCVVLAAPFDTPTVAGVEELVRRYAMLATGEPQAQLDEHRHHGLPDLEATIDAFETNGLVVRAVGNGNAFDWLLAMLLKHQVIARPALAPLDSGFDVLFNASLADRNERGPFYRHVIVAVREGHPEIGAPPEPVDGTPDDLSGLLAALISANATEATRQDLVRVDQAILDIDATRTELRQLVTALREDLEALRDQVGAIATALDVVRHPARALGQRVRRSKR